MNDPRATQGLRLSTPLLSLRRHPRLRTLTDYAQLCRLDRPIGIFLLLWPPMWALWIASRGMPPLKLLLVFVAGTVVMRSAGCIINDFADRRIDPHVKRTRDRPLAARRVSPQEALVLFGLLVAIALWLVTRLDRHTVLLSFVGAGLTISYPFMKRFFPLPQFYLGAAFGWAVPMAFAATLGHIPKVGWLLFLVAVIWAGVYDTVYAMVDRDDDLRLDVRSTAILFGDMDRLIVGCLQGLVLLGLLLAGREAGLEAPFFWSLLVGAALFGWQQWLIRQRSREGCFRAFLNNHWFGLAVFVGTALGVP